MSCREWPRAAHFHTRTGPQRAPGRRVLLADRPWLIADLRAWRYRQSRAWRLLRDRRLSCGDAGGPDRVRRALVISPVAVGVIGIAVERLLFRRFYRSDPILSLLLTFGLAMVIEQGLRIVFGATPLPFSIPPELRGQIFIGDFIYSRYRLIIL